MEPLTERARGRWYGILTELGVSPKSQMFALRWIHMQPQARSRWMRNGKDAYGNPDKWDAIELSGPNGSKEIKKLLERA
jgi:hypothetical protein